MSTGDRVMVLSSPVDKMLRMSIGDEIVLLSSSRDKTLRMSMGDGVVVPDLEVVVSESVHFVAQLLVGLEPLSRP